MDSEYGLHGKQRNTVWPALGLGLLWAWRNYISSWAVDVIQGASQGLTMQCWLYMGGFIGALLCAAPLGKRLGAKGLPGLFSAIGVCCGICSGFALALNGAPEMVWLFYVVLALAFCLGEVLLIGWGALAAQFKMGDAVVAISASFIVSFIIFPILSAVRSPLIGLLTASIVPLISGLLLAVRHSRSRPVCCELQEKHEPSNSVRPAMTTLTILAIFIGIEELLRIALTQAFAQEAGMTVAFTGYSQAGGLIACLIVFLLSFARRRELRFSTITRTLLPLMVLGFVLPLFSGGRGSIVSALVLGSSYWCLYSLVWTTAVYLSRETGMRLYRLLAYVEACIGAANIVSLYIGSRLDVDSGSPIPIIAVAVFAAVAGAMVLLNDRSARMLEVPAAPERDGEKCASDLMDGRLRQQGGSATSPAIVESGVTEKADGPDIEGLVAQRYGLSARECEVFLMLSKGRSLPYIEKELSIAHGTAQTHVRHIYEKMGVHSRQELIDMSERLKEPINEHVADTST